MKRRYYQLLMLMLSAIMTLMGAAGCKTLKFGRNAVKRQQQAYLDSIAKANALQQYRQDSIEQARIRQAIIQDSLRREEEIQRTKTIYGGPNMMGRKFNGQKKSE